LPPAAKTLFEKRVLDSQKLFRVLDSQKLFIKMVFIAVFSSCPFMLHCIFVAKIRRWIQAQAPIPIRDLNFVAPG
jgi:ABC-type iron transport system FetAB permease component